MSRLRSDISVARGLGSAKSGTRTYLLERLTSLALIPLGLWFVIALISLILNGGEMALSEWLQSPFSAVMMALFVFFSFWHSKMGMTVIIEDYVHSHFKKNTLLLLNAALHIVLGLISLMAVIKLHFLMELPL